jgi:hypothetical protein
MLSVEEQIQQLLKPRTLPVEMNVTGGTGVEKFRHAINASGIIEKYDPAIRSVTKTQLTTELMKLAGDKTLGHIIHSANMWVDYNENDFARMNKQFNPILMNDFDKVWNSLDYDSLESLLDLFFGGPLDLLQALNGVTVELLEKWKNEPVGYVADDYTNRTRIGVYLQSGIADKIIYNRVSDEFLKDYLANKGFGLIKMTADALKEDGFSGKAELNKYVNSQVDMVLEQPHTENGFVVLSPVWGYSARSMTEGRLDVALGLRNSVNIQDDDRVMSGCATTIDGLRKLVGLKIKAGFTHTTTDWSRQQSDYIRELYTEQKQENHETDPLGPWIRGANIFRRITEAGNAQLVTESNIKDILTDSERAYRECINSISHTDTNFWKPEILDILSKLNINKGKTKTSKLIEKIKKRIQNNTKPAKTGSKTAKTQEQETKELIVYIMESLVGIIGIIKGVGATNKLYTVRDCVEQIGLDKTYSQAFEKTLGILPAEYIELLDTKAMPESSMNHLLQGYIEEMSK